MLVLGSGHTKMSPPRHILWDALMHPGQHPKNMKHAWSTVVEHAPRIVESSKPDRVVWSTLWRNLPDVLVQFDLSDDGGVGSAMRWTLLGHQPTPTHSEILRLREQVSRLVNVDFRNAVSH